MVIRDGRKMSKHLGNVIDPDELVSKFGADTVRLAVLYAARPQRSLNWSDSAVQRSHRFLSQVWDYSQRQFEFNRLLAAVEASSPVDAPDKTEHLRTRLSKWCEIAVEKITEDLDELEMHSAVRNIMRLFDRIRDFEARVLAKHQPLGRQDSDALVAALATLAQVITPFAPHIGEELWEQSGHGSTLAADASWPIRALATS
jgi:leucyl-tRNA synthetase